ncbi:hypothetical protein C463_14855 [Halorubrum californiense DSM 19288]|uniref:Uncharacterized protein n=1 Tax=Halorubrum californiense DSM 19288 TaxID=1227465 RepID=M0E0Y0_9EURY|nr:MULTISPECIES: hypothetical protein [Halorubrum]ELZ40597.1 hypothetical protein C463_14855 [Halorubrum californiense DSM 19288]TKX66511.1 hypothetical protein EXE40_15985 [Halorubrum sp. GN11GM_10-3_MGM]
MDQRDARFILLSTLLAVTLLNTLDAPIAPWFQTASFALAAATLLYAGYVVSKPLLAWLPAR